MPDTLHTRPDRRPSEAAYWFLFDRDRLLLRHDADGWHIPLAAEPPVQVATAMEITGQVARTTPGPEPASDTTPGTTPVPNPDSASNTIRHPDRVSSANPNLRPTFGSGAPSAGSPLTDNTERPAPSLDAGPCDYACDHSNTDSCGRLPERYFASSVEVPQPVPDGMEWIALRTSYDLLGEPVYALAGKAFELVHWERNSRFCPACGTGMEPHSEISRRCPACGKELFPAISPAIIVLICKRDSILLARTCYSRSPFMGLVAGFLETGESLEACVHREVFEETGLQIRNLRYFGNQPWPYPSGLMVGFIADYAAGEIRLQKEELSEAAFFDRNHLPPLPPPLSLARRMIDWWLARPSSC